MKKSTTKQFILGTLTFLLLLNIGNELSAQGAQHTKSDYPHLYLSSAYVNTTSFSQGTHDVYYKGSREPYAEKTVRGDLGLQLNRNVAFEVGYIRTPLSINTEILLDDGLPGNLISGRSSARISFYSFKLKHSMPIFKKWLMFKTGLGYALGNSNVSLNTLGPSEPKTWTHYDYVITESKTTEGAAQRASFSIFWRS